MKNYGPAGCASTHTRYVDFGHMATSGPTFEQLPCSLLVSGLLNPYGPLEADTSAGLSKQTLVPRLAKMHPWMPSGVALGGVRCIVALLHVACCIVACCMLRVACRLPLAVLCTLGLSSVACCVLRVAYRTTIDRR